MTETHSDVAGVVNRWSMSRYDVVLAVIPVTLVCPAVLAHVFGVGTEVGLVFGSVAGGAALLDALLFNPPRGPQVGRKEA